MGAPRSALIHVNPHLPHQVRVGEAWLRGLTAHGIAARVVHTPRAARIKDVHVVIGPWFAYRQWLGKPNVLYVDRAFWGDPVYYSCGWLHADGSRTFAQTAGERYAPAPRDWKQREQAALLLQDWDNDLKDIEGDARGRFGFVHVRPHPARQRPSVSLESALALADVAIGHSTTALVDAVIAGVPVICTDPTNPVAEMAVPGVFDELRRPDRTAWLQRLAWGQWNDNEVASGLAWEHLRAVHQ